MPKETVKVVSVYLLEQVVVVVVVEQERAHTDDLRPLETGQSIAWVVSWHHLPGHPETA
jgi:hypothetical protein